MASSHVSIKQHFARLKDPRINRRKRHLLIDIIVIAVCAVICGCDSWPKIALFARKRRLWLQTFLELPNGVPSHDTFERVFARLNPEAFQSCFRQWMQTLAELLGVKHIAIDGKTLRGSGQASTHLGPLHLVSAWATQNHLTLGQVAVADKSNEITAIPRLLELLELNGALVTIDAIGCQKEIAKQIVGGGGDYVLTVKDNQPHLFEDIQEAFLKALDDDFAGLQHDNYRTREKGHGREDSNLRPPEPHSGASHAKNRVKYEHLVSYDIPYLAHPGIAYPGVEKAWTCCSHLLVGKPRTEGSRQHVPEPTVPRRGNAL